jgi:ubiquitin carboxyl-terminal hydrolase 25/28
LEEIGRKAVSIIAQARNSSFLKSWLEGDDPDQTTMNIDEALPLLGVGMPLNEMDATVWPDIFSSARSDKPGVQTERAIAAVQKALAGPSTGVNATHAPETWPVGLVSHGNTCYLNSLLQYYFSLKPLRDIVTDYDQYKMDISKSQEKLERVGQRRVSTQEILGGKKFADELRHLFGRMIKDRGTAVKPEQDLVCRAFLDPRDFAELEAQKSGNDNAIDDTTMPDLTSNGNVAEPEELDTPQSNASSQTLQADDHSADGQTGDVQMNDTDLPPSAQNAAPPSPPNSQPPSPSQKPVDQQADGSAPPPLPPRRFSTTTSDTLRQAQAKATQQQDVTEVHDSITQRLRAGMKPQGADNRGEQVDALRDLFAIGMSQTATSGTTISKPEFISDSSIQLNVPTEPSDLYSALDDYFDLQVVTEGSEKQQYRSILELPPLVQINMPRIGFNKETREAYKSDAPLRLEDELYLDRYCEDAASSVLERRRSAWGWRKNLLELKKEQKALQGTGVGVEGPAAVSETARFIKSLKDVNEELIAAGEDPIEGDLDVHVALEEDAVFQAQRLGSLDSQISTLQGKLTGTFDDLKEKKYRLYAVFFHRGGSSSGHYWVSIHDFQNDIWRSYNDESVTEVQPRELDNIFYANQWQHGTPTFAVYVRDDLKDKYVQAVCRAPEEAPPATDFSGDVTMTDNSQWGDNNADNVDPQALVKEGGNGSSWDPERDVPEAKW